MYNWYAANNDAGLCPSGWHLPTDDDWTTLTDYLGEESVAGEKMKSSSSDAPRWNGTNSSGFSGLLGGYRRSSGNFSTVNNLGCWWSASPNRASNAWGRELKSDDGNVGRYANTQRNEFSVRCVRDE
ncbi:MAG: FISUMP domain-containing protein [Flavobacteriales bacterium]